MMSLFIADDDEWILNGIKSIINWENYGVRIIGEASNGLAAYNNISKYRPDIIFTDIIMPGMTGLELLERLNQDKIYVDVIILTGHAEFDYAREACRLGAFDYLLKPLEEESLLETLERLKQKYNIMHDKEEKITEILLDQNTTNGTLKLLLDYIHKNYSQSLHLYEIAEHFHFNSSYIGQLFKKELNVSFSEYVTQLRLNMAEQLLKETSLATKVICEKVGINDYFYFNKLFKKYKGVTPNQARENNH